MYNNYKPPHDYPVGMSTFGKIGDVLKDSATKMGKFVNKADTVIKGMGARTRTQRPNLNAVARTRGALGGGISAVEKLRKGRNY